MGSREFYVILLPLSAIPSILSPSREAELSPEIRTPQQLNERRIHEITAYILENDEDWLFSSLTASFDAEPIFEPVSTADPNVGILRLPLTTHLFIIDGQHRRAAIKNALEEDPTLGSQTISVVLFPAESLERNQQMFSDLNRSAQTARSLNMLYDHRNQLNQITFSVAEKVPVLRGRVEMRSLSLAVRSAKFITISSLYDMLAQLVGPIPDHLPPVELEQIERQCVDFLNALTEILPQWRQVAERQLRPADARAEYVNAHAVFFFAVGGVGRVLSEANEMDRLPLLGEIDWRRTNSEWQGICMIGPEIVTRRQTREALREYILFRLRPGSSPPMRIIDKWGRF